MSGKDISMMLHRLAPAAVALLLVVGAAACSTAGPVGAPPTPPPAPTAAAAADCLDMSVQEDPVPQTTTNLSMFSTSVLVGTFKGYGGPKWNTPSGARPGASDFKSKPARILTPTNIKVDKAIRGDPSDGPHVFVRGGKLGCDEVDYSNAPQLQAGQSYVYFLAPVSDSEGKASRDLVILAAWPVASGDTVSTPSEGDLSVADLSAQVAAQPAVGSDGTLEYPSAPPEPSEDNRP